ncbi:hypothetical protein HMPREF9534_01546 [Escherichia coli MS 69-1]|nr:hypothetical protein HMPREF9534_01546 [Escherichia coli MS 69-1]
MCRSSRSRQIIYNQLIFKFFEIHQSDCFVKKRSIYLKSDFVY